MLNITEPELLISIHEQYLKAGADIIYANTFGGNRYKLEECGHSVDELVTAGIKNAKKACANVNPRALVALDVGPIGQLLEPTGTLSFEEAYEMYAEIVKAGEAAGADLVVFETMTDLLDVKAAVLAAKEKFRFCNIKHLWCFTHLHSCRLKHSTHTTIKNHIILL